MANFFLDNADIQFHFKNLDLASLAETQEDGFVYTKDFDYAPATADEAIENYRLALEALGELAAEYIAPRAEDVDLDGNALNDDGTVTYSKGMAENLDMLGKADAMGFTLAYRYGGLNFPNLIYSMAVEMVSRADASLMNLFGLQGIAETIQAFADDELKDVYLPRFSAGEVTGAMVLTEPDAGSDLQAVKLKATQNENGDWVLNGVKRFITNGCGEVLLVLARSEPGESGGLGLSLFLVERGPYVRTRRLEDKLGIHGSPTCELVFKNAPGKLIGERKRGLVTYVMALMNGARVGIGAQGLGIAQAAVAEARAYAHSRQQFGMRIEQMPAVADLMADMQVEVEAARALLYETSLAVDQERRYIRITDGFVPVADADAKREAKRKGREMKRIAGMLTPMCKYYNSEMCQRVASNAIQVLGGSGYMRDYSLERNFRDSRITTIYEGTSQLQIVAAVLSVVSGTVDKYLDGLAGKVDAQYGEPLAEARKQMADAVAYVKEQGAQYRDLYARELVDAAVEILIGYLFARDAAKCERKAIVAKRWIGRLVPRVRARVAMIRSGDTSTISQFETIVGPVAAG